MPRRLAAIMFTDIAGYTQLSQTDEPAALRLLQEQEKLMRSLLAAHQGRRVKSTGDGLLLEFEDALDAVECGAEFQRQVHERNAQGDALPLRIRVGIHLGDVQRRGTDILGDAVNIASRIEPLAEPGGICISEHVFAQVSNKVAYPLERLGPRSLKGVREPINVYRVVLPWTAQRAATDAPTVPRIAVLPLANISPDPKDEYFADGLTEELITVLSQIKGLRVISRTSVNQYKGTTKPVAQIGSELGADSVLEGSVRKAGEKLRISVQLIDAKSDEHRWAQTYDRRLEDVFAIQAEVAEQTASALKLKLMPSEREAIRERPTSNLVAYESYLRGIRASRQMEESQGAPRRISDQEAVTHFESAIGADPGFSAAYSHLAAHLLLVSGETGPMKPSLPRIEALVRKALELNPESSDAHAACGNLRMQGDLDWTRAEAEFQHAIALNPSSSIARFWYGSLLHALQRFDEEKKQLLVVVEQDPLWLAPKVVLAGLPWQEGDLASMVTAHEDLARRFSDNLLIQEGLAICYAVAHRADDALKLIERLKGATDHWSRHTRALVLVFLGDGEELRSLIADWEQGRLRDYVHPALVAGYYAFLGEREKALSLLEKDYQEGDRAIWVVYQGLEFDGIREDPRFAALLRAAHLPMTLVRPLRMENLRRPN